MKSAGSLLSASKIAAPLGLVARNTISSPRRKNLYFIDIEAKLFGGAERLGYCQIEKRAQVS